MTIDEAIKELERVVCYVGSEDPKEQYAAVQLGIEALKEVKTARLRSHFDPVPYLPGETT